MSVLVQLGISATIVLALALPAACQATIYEVDRTDDPPGKSECTPAPEDCSLRQAADKVDADPGLDEIRVGAGEYVIDSGIAFETPVHLIGAGARQTIVRSRGKQVLAISDEVSTLTSEFAGMTATGGRNEGENYGAGVVVQSPLIVRGMAIVDNVDGARTETPQLYPGWGGGVYVEDDLTVIDSLIARNKAAAESNGTVALGAGMRISGGEVVVRNSTIAENIAAGGTVAANGGGVSVSSTSSLTLENATVVDNSVVGGPGTAASNLAAEPGAVIVVRNSIVARGTGAGSCERSVISRGGNVGDGPDCGFSAADRIANPLLGPLSNNGGQTDTYSLLFGSPAIGFAGACGLATDQRGQPRPATSCDSGAFQTSVQAPRAVNCGLSVTGSSAGLKAQVNCDADASLTIAGTATISPPVRKKHGGKASSVNKKPKKPKPVALQSVTATASAGKALTVAIPLPKRVQLAAKSGRRVSLAFTLTAHSSVGALAESSAKIAKLKSPPRKKRHGGK